MRKATSPENHTIGEQDGIEKPREIRIIERIRVINHRIPVSTPVIQVRYVCDIQCDAFQNLLMLSIVLNFLCILQFCFCHRANSFVCTCFIVSTSVYVCAKALFLLQGIKVQVMVHFYCSFLLFTNF